MLIVIESETEMLRKYKELDRAEVSGVEHIDGLYSYAVAVTCNRTEAATLVQETYVRAMRTSEGSRSTGTMKKDLFVTLRNLCISRLDHEESRLPFGELEASDPVANRLEQLKNSDKHYVSATDAEQVQAAIERLPIRLREVIVLREYGRLSYQEMADVLDCPVDAVMSQLRSARLKLRTLLATTLKRCSRLEEVASTGGLQTLSVE
jgi:RNA polymerase sigma-70 factor, ECF subfamily